MIGSYGPILLLDRYLNTSLIYIVLNVMKRAVVPDFYLLNTNTPFQASGKDKNQFHCCRFDSSHGLWLLSKCREFVDDVVGVVILKVTSLNVCARRPQQHCFPLQKKIPPASTGIERRTHDASKNDSSLNFLRILKYAR